MATLFGIICGVIAFLRPSEVIHEDDSLGISLIKVVVGSVVYPILMGIASGMLYKLIEGLPCGG